jgi:HEAT repeat protein
MKKLATALLILFLIGCGTAASQKSGAIAAKNGKPKKPATKAPAKVAAKPAASAPAPPPKKYIVAPDAYGDIPEALVALLLAAESSGENEDADREERFKASAWLALQKEAAIEPLVEKLNDENVGLASKIVICRTLGQIGLPAEAPLTAALESDDQLVRINAAEQLAIIKPTSPSIVQTLIALLDHDDPRTAERAVKSLAHIGPPAKDSADRLLAILNSDADEGLRSEAKRALKSVSPRKTFQD